MDGCSERPRLRVVPRPPRVRLKDELATVRSSYDRQLALLSDRLADLTGRRGGAPTTKRH